MRVKQPSIQLMATLAIFAVALFATSTRAAAQEKVLHVFLDDLVDGTTPQAGLIFDAAGNLYGTTVERRAYWRRDGVRVVARRGRKLDGEGAVELRQRHGRGRVPSPG